MLTKFLHALLVASLLFLWGCSSTIMRLPAAIETNYDAEQVRLLKNLARHGILVQFNEAFLPDLPRIQVAETCNKIDDNQWRDQFFSILKVFERYPDFHKKIHVIHFKRGDRPSIEIDKDITDQAVIIELSYQKVLTEEPFFERWQQECNILGNSADQARITRMEWPTAGELLEFLQALPEKSEVARFKFDTSFLTYLADRRTVLRLTPALAAEKALGSEKSRNGKPILPETINKLSSQVRSGKYRHIDYWLNQIDSFSRLGKNIKFFSILDSQKLSTGIGVDGSASILSQQFASTYLYISYRSRNGEYQHATLENLNTCLQDFNDSNVSKKAERFLHPGFNCDQE